MKDNSNVIPGNIKKKIFQPFFTITPIGEGMGLGLNLSYDFVKSYVGELMMKTKECECLYASQAGIEFIIQLPVKN